jgi:hypothetical protein
LISAHQNVSVLFPPIKMFRPYFRPSKCFGLDFCPSKCFGLISAHQNVSALISAHQNVSARLPPIKIFRPYFRPSKYFGLDFRPSKCFGLISAHQNVSALFPPINMFRPYFRPSTGTTIKHLLEGYYPHNKPSPGRILPHNQHMVRDSSVGIATCYGLNVSGIESRCGSDFPHPFRPALGLKQPPVQWLSGLFTGGKAAEEWL